MFLKNKIKLALFCIFICNSLLAQLPAIEIVEQGRKTSIRGLCVVTNDIVWVSGSGGSVGKSINGGKTWSWMTVPGYEKTDFRDIEAFDENTAIIMGITQPAVVLKTKDGGNTWKKVYEDTANEAFFDAMDFTIKDKDTAGILIGDPVDGLFYHVFSSNAGDNWMPRNTQNKPSLQFLKDGEAFFASSGTNIAWLPINEKDFTESSAIAFLVSGGTTSKMYPIPLNPNKSYPLNLLQGKQSTGANSIAVHAKSRKGMIVGGDFSNDSIVSGNATMFSFDKKNSTVKFYQPINPPHGYRSCVIFIDEKQLITCGTSGVDISKDSGMNWTLLSKESFHVVQKAKKGTAVFLAGGRGRIGKLQVD